VHIFNLTIKKISEYQVKLLYH